MAYNVHFEPVDVDMEVEEGETVLKAAFRQGIFLMHGCKEGQCGSCKSILLDGDIDLMKYSTFALPDFEKEQNYILLCRTIPFSDLTIELVNYDEDILKRAIPVKSYPATITAIQALTHDIRLLQVELDEGQRLRFWAGQYADLTLPDTGITRSFSMANTPQHNERLEFMIKLYPDGAFSSQLDGRLKPGDKIVVTGPYGITIRRENNPQPMILVGGGAGLGPLWSMVNDLVEKGEQRPVKFFYGVRAKRDLFYLDRFAQLAEQLPDFEFIPALSDPQPQDHWEGETGFIHEVVNRRLDRFSADNDVDAYLCGPPPMIDACIPVLRQKLIDPENIHFDKFFASTT